MIPSAYTNKSTTDDEEFLTYFLIQRICMEAFPIGLGKSYFLRAFLAQLKEKGYTELELIPNMLINNTYTHAFFFLDDVIALAQKNTNVILPTTTTEESNSESINTGVFNSICSVPHQEVKEEEEKDENFYGLILRVLRERVSSQNQLATSFSTFTSTNVNMLVSGKAHKFSRDAKHPTKIVLLYSRHPSASMVQFTLACLLNKIPKFFDIMNHLKIRGNLNVLKNIKSSYKELVAKLPRPSSSTRNPQANLENLQMLTQMLVHDLKGEDVFSKTVVGDVQHLGTINVETLIRHKLFRGSRQALLEYGWLNTVIRGRKFEIELYKSQKGYSDFFGFYLRDDDMFEKFMQSLYSLYSDAKVELFDDEVSQCDDEFENQRNELVHRVCQVLYNKSHG